MPSLSKPEIEHLKKFHLLDLMSARHLNYLREKSSVEDYIDGDVLFSPPRTTSMGYYLLEGAVDIKIGGETKRTIKAESSAAYCSLEDRLPDNASALASGNCKVLQLDRELVEQYFSWSTTGEFRAVDLESINKSIKQQQTEWAKPLLNSVLVKHMEKEAVEKFIALFEEVRVREGELLLHHGDQAEHFYVIKSGKATLTAVDGLQRTLRTGSYFGEESIIPDAASDCQVIMDTTGLVARIPRRVFNHNVRPSLIKSIPITRLKQIDKARYKILDVRFPAEYKAWHMEESINLPVSVLRNRVKALPPDCMYFISPECSVRGELACYIMQQAGYRAFLLEDDEFSVRQLA